MPSIHIEPAENIGITTSIDVTISDCAYNYNRARTIADAYREVLIRLTRSMIDTVNTAPYLSFYETLREELDDYEQCSCSSDHSCTMFFPRDVLPNNDVLLVWSRFAEVNIPYYVPQNASPGMRAIISHVRASFARYGYTLRGNRLISPMMVTRDPEADDDDYCAYKWVFRDVNDVNVCDN